MGKLLRWLNAGGLPWGLSFGMTQTLEGHVAFWGYRQWFLCTDCELKTLCHCGWPITDPPYPQYAATHARKKWAETMFSSPYSAFEEKGCSSAFPKLASWADPHGQTSPQDRLCPAVSDVSSPAVVVPGMWEALRYFLNEQTSLNCAFVFIFSFSWQELIYHVDVSRSFFWVLRYLLCELTALCCFFNKGWCLSIDSNTCFLPLHSR